MLQKHDTAGALVYAVDYIIIRVSHIHLQTTVVWLLLSHAYPAKSASVFCNEIKVPTIFETARL